MAYLRGTSDNINPETTNSKVSSWLVWGNKLATGLDLLYCAKSMETRMLTRRLFQVCIAFGLYKIQLYRSRATVLCKIWSKYV